MKIPIIGSPNEFQNMTINGLNAISPVMKLKLLPIPNTIKKNTKVPRNKALFIFLNKSINFRS